MGRRDEGWGGGGWGGGRRKEWHGRKGARVRYQGLYRGLTKRGRSGHVLALSSLLITHPHAFIRLDLNQRAFGR